MRKGSSRVERSTRRGGGDWYTKSGMGLIPLLHPSGFEVDGDGDGCEGPDSAWMTPEVESKRVQSRRIGLLGLWSSCSDLLNSSLGFLFG